MSASTAKRCQKVAGASCEARPPETRAISDRPIARSAPREGCQNCGENLAPRPGCSNEPTGSRHAARRHRGSRCARRPGYHLGPLRGPLLLLLLNARSAAAHEGHAHATENLATRWTPDPIVLSLLGISALLYAVGFFRMRARSERSAISGWQGAAFAAGWASMALALVSPLDYLSEVLFSAHMTQHEILMLVSAPLLVLGAPLAPMLAALPAALRRRAVAGGRTRLVGNVWRFLTGPWNVWILQAVVLLVWHIPLLYDAALAHEGIHFVQHVSFLGAAVLFFWALVHGRYGRIGYGMAVFYVFTTALYTSLFGALLTVAPRPWYALHEARTRAWNVEPLADQQLAGLIMWVPAGAVFLVIGLALFAAWLGALGRRTAQAERGTR